MSTNKRQTQQRVAIVNAIEGLDCAFTPQELLEQSQRSYPGIGIATVYRSIRALAKEGRLRRVVLVGGAPRYERTDVNHHHHFHCESCGKVAPLEGCPLDESYRFPKGFKVISHEITFSGICPDCARAS